VHQGLYAVQQSFGQIEFDDFARTYHCFMRGFTFAIFLPVFKLFFSRFAFLAILDPPCSFRP